MMEYTDMHQRHFMRLLSKHCTLYTEMVTANALVRCDDPVRFLEAEFGVEEPVVLQLGGGEVQLMRDAAKMAHEFGYRQFNINCGCPSEKVAGAGCFGAALMLSPHLVAELALAVGEVTGVPATIKCRIGVDDRDSYEELHAFIKIVSEVGKVDHFIVHARKALLVGKFTPDDNRKIPPLRHEVVYRLAHDFPHLIFTLNGGILDLDTCKAKLHEADSQGANALVGIMVGRAVIDTPFMWSVIDSELYGVPNQEFNRREILQQYAAYAQVIENAQGSRARRALMKPLLNLFHAEKNGRLFRNKLDDFIKNQECPISDVFLNSAQVLSPETLDLRPSEMLMQMRHKQERRANVQASIGITQINN